MLEEEGSPGRLDVFDQRHCKYKLSLSWMRKAAGRATLEGTLLFGYGYVVFERPIKHGSEATQWASGERSGLETSQ